MKTILKRQPEPLFSFTGPNSHPSVFALIEQSKVWFLKFNKIIFESHSLDNVKTYAHENNIQFEDCTKKQLRDYSARPLKVN